MGGYENIKRACSFYVSSIHLITMILPYIKKQIDLNIEIATFLEYNLKENVNEVISKLMSENKTEKQIVNLDWNAKSSYKFSNVEKEIKNKLNNNKELNIIITGSNKYIEIANENLNKFFMKNIKKIKEKYITIIDCYEVTQFNDNIKDILDTHDVILNTSGINKISDVFDGYKRRAAL